jgi:hypothetical protein
LTGNAVRSFSAHGQQSAAKGSSTTVSRSDNIQLTSHFDSSAHGLVRRWLLTGCFAIHLVPPLAADGLRQPCAAVGGPAAEGQGAVRAALRRGFPGGGGGARAHHHGRHLAGRGGAAHHRRPRQGTHTHTHSIKWDTVACARFPLRQQRRRCSATTQAASSGTQSRVPAFLTLA